MGFVIHLQSARSCAGTVKGSIRAARLNHLSTFLGHVNPQSTAVYLTITSRVARGSQRALRGVCSATVQGGTVMTTSTLGALVQEFFLSHLVEQKGLRQSSVRSYRDTLRLFLQFAADRRSSAGQQAHAAKISASNGYWPFYDISNSSGAMVLPRAINDSVRFTHSSSSSRAATLIDSASASRSRRSRLSAARSRRCIL